MTDKKILRNTIQHKRSSLEDYYFIHANEHIVQRVLTFHGYKNADSLFIYLSTTKEPETDRIIDHALRSDKKVFVPKCLAGNRMKAVQIHSADEYRLNRFNIREPVCSDETEESESLDLIVVPCVSANDHGARIGHGGGYYDRFLAQTNAMKLCLCYDALLSAEVPQTPHDVPMDYLITESKTVRCR